MICPLNWGWGHATRIIPIVNKCIEHGHEVILGVSGDSGKFLANELPELKQVSIASPGIIRYSRSNNQIFAILFHLPLLVAGFFHERKRTRRLVKREGIDLIISDNRYGLRDKSAYSVFITHQLKVIFPRAVRFFEPLFHAIQNSVLRKFDEIWLPDDKDGLNLTGQLSSYSRKKLNVLEVGILSRLQTDLLPDQTTKYSDVLVILSGPEPQRSILEAILVRQLKHSGLKSCVVRGTFQAPRETYADMEVYSFMNTNELNWAMQQSRWIVCRSGYSSVMDLIRMGKQAILIPTPGQTEQEYLAQSLMTKGYFYSVSQDKINLLRDLKHAIDYHPPKEPGKDLLDQNIRKFDKRFSSQLKIGDL